MDKRYHTSVLHVKISVDVDRDSVEDFDEAYRSDEML